MSEYIIEWLGIGEDVTNLLKSGSPQWKVIKTIRNERLRESVTRCRDCKNFHPRGNATLTCRFKHPSMANTVEWCYAEPDGFCKWGERRGV